MHSSSETSRWCTYYRVSNNCTKHIGNHNPYRTKLDVCILPEHCCTPGALIYDNSFSSGWLHLTECNIPCHRGQITREWFKESSNKFQIISWPSNSLEMIGIKHCGFTWRTHFVLPCYLIAMCDNHRTYWWAFGTRYARRQCQKRLVKSMCRQAATVLRAKGCPMS